MTTNVLPIFGVAPPEAGDPVSYVIDVNGTPRTTYGDNSEPYPPAAMWTRMAMGRSRRTTAQTIECIKRYLTERQTDICELLGFSDEYRRKDASGIAAVLLIHAVLLEVGSPLMIVTVWPNGYAEVWTWRASDQVFFSYLWNHVTGEWQSTPTLDGEGRS